MDIIYLRFPGRSIDLPDEIRSLEVRNLVLALEDALIDAAFALALYRDHTHRTHAEIADLTAHIERIRNMPPRQAIALGNGLRSQIDHPNLGTMPRGYTFRLDSFFAGIFIDKLASVQRGIGVLRTTPSLPPGTMDAIQACVSALGSLVSRVRDIRDSQEHIEDRIRGRDRTGKRIPFDAISLAGVEIGDGMGSPVSHIRNNQYGWHTASGAFEEVEISSATLAQYHICVQNIISALPWTGEPWESPYYGIDIDPPQI